VNRSKDRSLPQSEKNTFGCFLFGFFNKIVDKRLTIFKNTGRFNPLPNERKGFDSGTPKTKKERGDGHEI
jgi:hypothetical protein